MVANFQIAHAGTDLLHDPGALVSADDGHWYSGKVAGAVLAYLASARPPSARIQLAKLPTRKYSVTSSIPMPPFSLAFCAVISGNRMMLLAATTAVAIVSCPPSPRPTMSSRSMGPSSRPPLSLSDACGWP